MSAISLLNVNDPETEEKLREWARSTDGSSTFARRVAGKLMKYKWYYPNRDKPTMPKLKEGWAHYEHYTLARCKGRFGEPKGLYPERVLPGSVGGSRLYSYWTTPESAFKDWGVGIGLYFSTMRVFALALFVAGLCSLRNIIYFSSSDYRGMKGADDSETRGISWILRGSAICDAKEWVPCEDGYCDLAQMKRAGITYARDEVYNLTFVQKLGCPSSDTNDNDIWKAGMWNIFTITVLIAITVGFGYFQSRQQTIMDEDQITASDYSVRVLNPPTDAYDPDEWRDFFSIYDTDKGVTFVTVILNNAPLLRALKVRRYLCKELKRRIPDAVIDHPVSNDLREKVLSKSRASEEKVQTFTKKILFHAFLRPILRLFGKYLDPQVLLKKIEERTEEIEELLKKDYDVTSVIVTFESEQGKRRALEALQASKIDIKRQNTNRGHDLFRGEVVLDVIEPTEPSAIRYLDLDVTPMKNIIQFCITLFLTFGLITLSAWLVNLTRKSSGAFWAGILTTTLNILIPVVVRLLLLIEKHPREDDRQRSLYIKVTLFRWVNTAIATKFIVPFTSTLGSEKDDLLVALNGILLAEMWMSPALSVLDILGNLSKHYYAPRATIKEQMLLCFKGTHYNLADKYTDFTKIVFVSYYYSSLNPTMYFLASIVLLIRYAADKYCLLFVWGDVPNIGTQVAEFSRKYFLSFAIVAGTFVSAYDYGLYNFDRVCNGMSEESFQSNGNYDVKIFPKEETDNIEVANSSDRVRVCNGQKCCQEVGFTWPPVPSRFQQDPDFIWMTPGQETISSLFGSLSVFVLVVFFFGVFGHTIWTRITSYFVRTRTIDQSKQEQNIDFSNLEVDAYIPMIREPALVFPLIACDMDEIKQSNLGFKVTEESIDDYNLIFDIPHEGMKRCQKIVSATSKVEMLSEHAEFKITDHNNDEKERHIYHIVKHWPFGGK